MPFCVFSRATGLYLRGARYDSLLRDPANEVEVTLSDFPDARTTRWDGNRSVRDATTQEVTDYDDAQRVVDEQRAFDDLKMIKALALVIADLHSLTPLQMRNLVITKYRSL